MKISRRKFRRVRLALRHKKLTRAHEAAVTHANKDPLMANALLDAVAIGMLGLGPEETKLLLAAQEDENANS